MSLSRAQQILLKRAQAEAALPDTDYRMALSDATGLANCATSKDSRLTDEHLDVLLAYFESIYWRKVDAGQPRGRVGINGVFRQPNYWRNRNRRGQSSRDRYVAHEVTAQISAVETELGKFGCGLAYFQSIQNNMRGGSGHLDPVKYLAALKRTLVAKRSKLQAVHDPAAKPVQPW